MIVGKYRYRIDGNPIPTPRRLFDTREAALEAAHAAVDEMFLPGHTATIYTARVVPLAAMLSRHAPRIGSRVLALIDEIMIDEAGPYRPSVALDCIGQEAALGGLVIAWITADSSFDAYTAAEERKHTYTTPAGAKT